MACPHLSTTTHCSMSLASSLSGPTLQERSAIESDFASGRVRVVVATVAFGMGALRACM